MDRLWSPWRMAYVSGASGSTPAESCIFCAAATPPGRDALVVIRRPLAFVVLNLYPYNSGHLLIAPTRHVATLADTTADERAELMRLTRHAEIALTEVYSPQGLNVGMNLGRPAGAGIVDHLHVHAVPRWNGDTSFMSVVGETRVLPEELGQTAARLRPVFERLGREDR